MRTKLSCNVQYILFIYIRHSALYWSQIYVFALITTILNFYHEQTTICIFNFLSYKYQKKQKRFCLK